MADIQSPWVLRALGFVLAAEIVVEVTLRSGPSLPAAGAAFWIGVATSGPFVLLLLSGGRWLPETVLAPERFPRVLGWTAVSTAFFLLSVGGISLLLFDPIFAVVGTLRWSAAVGAGIGLLVGGFEVRTIEQRVSAREAAVRADEQERRRELLTYLNALLRHEVLNAANVIDGYAARIETSDAHGDAAVTIRRQVGRLTAVTEDVQTLLTAAEGIEAADPVDLVAVVDARVSALEERVDRVDVETDLPDSAVVAADDLLWRVIDNLLSNAVDHNDAATPAVAVGVTVDDEVVRLRVADDGPGVPEDERESLFEYTTTGRSDHGLGLAVTRALVERYAGGIELAETGPDGSVFAVELPRADGEADLLTAQPAPDPDDGVEMDLAPDTGDDGRPEAVTPNRPAGGDGRRPTGGADDGSSSVD